MDGTKILQLQISHTNKPIIKNSNIQLHRQRNDPEQPKHINNTWLTHNNQMTNALLKGTTRSTDDTDYPSPQFDFDRRLPSPWLLQSCRILNCGPETQ